MTTPHASRGTSRPPAPASRGPSTSSPIGRSHRSSRSARCRASSSGSTRRRTRPRATSGSSGSPRLRPPWSASSSWSASFAGAGTADSAELPGTSATTWPRAPRRAGRQRPSCRSACFTTDSSSASSARASAGAAAASSSRDGLGRPTTRLGRGRRHRPECPAGAARGPGPLRPGGARRGGAAGTRLRAAARA